MHSLLKRQLRRYFGDKPIPDACREFLNAVNDAYEASDQDRKMLERSLELSSQELLQANAEMRAVFQAIPDLLFRLDRDGKIIDYKAGGADDFFLPPAALIGRRIQDVPFEDISEDFGQAIEKVQATRSLISFDYAMQIHGQKQHYEARILPLLKDQIVVIIRNITRRKQFEETLRDFQKRLENIISFLPDATFVIDKEGRVIAWNRAIEAMTGVSAEEMVGKTDYEYALPFYGERRPILIDLVFMPQREVEKKYTQVKRQGSTLIGEVYIPSCRGGEIFLWGAACALYDSDGNVTGAIECIRDVTESKRAEAATVRAEEKYRSIFENAAMGIFQCDFKGRFLSANPSFARILGYDSPEDLMCSVSDIALQMWVNPKRRTELLHLVKRQETITEFEIETFRKDGSVVWLTLNVQVVRDAAGNLSYVDCSAQDITDRKALELKLIHSQKMEAIGTLAGGIAHDFNNVLSVILGYSEMTVMNPDPSRIQEYVAQISKAANRAKDMVQQILAFSRNSEKEVGPVNMALLVRETLTLLRATIPSTIKIRENILDGGHTVQADSTQMHQILLNLCTNAAWAMREKGGTLEIGLCDVEIQPDMAILHSELKPGVYVNLTVSDTGVGMMPDVVQRIFDPFFTTKKIGEGTGLGLSVVYGIVKDHGGALIVWSEPLVGSVFNVYLPAVVQEDQPVKSDAEEPIPTGCESILLVDDEPSLTEMWRNMLQGLGYRMTVMTDAVKALEIFDARPDDFDIVLTDMTMPDMTGLALSKELLEIRPDIPIILFTGFSEMVTEEDARKAGIRDFFMKPVSLREIACSIREILDLLRK